MTSVVIVDARRQRLIEEFRKAGTKIIRVQSAVDEPGPGSENPDLSRFIGNVVHSGDLETTAAAVAGYSPIAVVAGSETGVELADALAEKLGCAGNGTLLSAARRDKYLMVEAVRRAGLAAARQTATVSATELADWHDSIGGRIVVKPLRSSAGDSVFFCDSTAESVAAFDRIHGSKNIFAVPNIGVVAQEYLAGTEYMVNTASRDGCHRICEVWSTTRIPVNGVPELADSYHLMPRTGAVQDELAAYTEGVLDALGIRHGPAHTEIRMTDNGPVLVEIGARMCGDNLPYYVQLAQGESQLDWTVRAYLDPSRFLRTYRDIRQTPRLCSVVRLIAPASGLLRGYRRLPALRRLTSFYDVQLAVRPGSPIRRTVTNLTCPGAVILMHDDEAVLRRDANTVRRLTSPDFYDIDGER